MSSPVHKALLLVAGIVAITWTTIVLVRCGGPGTGRPIGAKLVADLQGMPALALTDHLDDEDSIRARVTRVDLATGRLIDRETWHAESATFSAPEQHCDFVREIPGAPTLRLPPYSGQIGAPRNAETPEGEITIAAEAGGLGFLAARRAPVMVDGDALLVHLHAFAAHPPDEGRQSWVSRIDRRGLPVWSYRLAGGCQLATLHGELLVLAVKAGEHRAVALDVKTGVPRWQFDN